MRRLLLSIAFLLPATALASDCKPSENGALASLSDGVKSALFWVGARALNTVSPSPAYPTSDEARAKRNAEIAKTIEKKKLATNPVIVDLRATGADDVDLFHGSHIVVEDGGALYDKWKSDARPRTSSHYKDVAAQQYEIEFPKMGALLFGKDADGNTWFQTEAHTDGPDRLSWALHRLDYVKHKGFGFVNVGPLGLSPKSEKQGREVRITP